MLQVQFPGYVVNLDKAVHLLGGEEKIMSVLRASFVYKSLIFIQSPADCAEADAADGASFPARRSLLSPYLRRPYYYLQHAPRGFHKRYAKSPLLAPCPFTFHQAELLRPPLWLISTGHIDFRVRIGHLRVYLYRCTSPYTCTHTHTNKVSRLGNRHGGLSVVATSHNGPLG